MLCRGWHALLCGQPPCTSCTAPTSFSSDSFLSLAATPQRLSRFDGIHGPVLAVHWRPFSSWAGLRSSLLYLGPSWPSVRITDELTRAKQTPVLLAPPLLFFFWTSQMTQSLEILSGLSGSLGRELTPTCCPLTSTHVVHAPTDTRRHQVILYYYYCV